MFYTCSHLTVIYLTLMLIEFLHSFSDGKIRRNHYGQAVGFVRFSMLLQIQLLVGYFGLSKLTSRIARLLF